jgi:hypothetical protein
VDVVSATPCKRAISGPGQSAVKRGQRPVKRPRTVMARLVRWISGMEVGSISFL